MRDRWIRNRWEYQIAYREGIKKTGKRFIIYNFPRQRDELRFGITVTKKIGKAVVRNRTKRRLREIIRKNFRKWNKGSDIIIVARKSIIDSSYIEIEKELLKMLTIIE